MDVESIAARVPLHDVEVAVVGAGPVGLMLANLLGIAGVQVAVLEANEGLRGLPRAIAYDAETLRLFSQIGLIEEIVPGLIQNPRVRHLNARGRVLLQADLPTCGPYGHSSLGTFHQPEFERVLLGGLARFDNVKVLFGHTVTNLAQSRDDAVVSIATRHGADSLRAKYVVGCDGGTSRIRDLLGARLSGSTYTERWLVVDAIVKGHDVRQISFYCDPSRPRVEVPAVGDRVRWEFMQQPGETEEELKNDSRIMALIAENTRYREVQVERKAVYTFHARVADRWRNGRGFLAGDAAHLMPPFAGQGMNGGMKDAVNLAWKLSAVLRGLAAETILDSYESERAPVVRKMVEVSRRLGAVIMPTNHAVAALRDAIFACLNMSRAFREFIGRGGVVPPPAIGRSPLTGTASDALIGQMILQPIVKTAEGSFPLDTFQTCHQWLVLGIGVDPATMLSPRDLGILDALDVRFVCLNGRSERSATLELRCDDAVFDAWVKRHRLRAVLVRPDRFIADRLNPRGADLPVLTPFAQARGVAAPRVAARTGGDPMSVNPTLKSGPGFIELARGVSPVVKASQLLYAHFERPDLETAERYLVDFGLVPVAKTEKELFLRGTGQVPYIYRVTLGRNARFLGIGFLVPKAEDLEMLARKCGSRIERADGPGGGSVVHLRDPEGVAVHVHHGFTPSEPLPVRPPILHNAPSQTVRVNDTQRPKLEPPQVTKLGHLVLETPDFNRSVRWYMDTFGFIPSDVLCLADGAPVGSFTRLDRGNEPTDHHTVFIAMGMESKVDHVAFEVVDLDAVEMGQQVLMAKRYRHAWGVGRHLLGSQIFDYWRDPWGQKHEHYADGDLFDAAQPTGYHLMDRGGLYQWGPDLPDDFIDARMTPARLWRVLRLALKDKARVKLLVALKNSMAGPGRQWQR